MAGITSTLRLNDMMTSVLRRINRSMSTTIDSLEAVQRASGQTFNDQNILAARREIDLANRELDAMADHYNRVENSQEQFNRSVAHGGSAVDVLTSKLKGMAGAFFGIAGIKKALDLSDTMTSTTARLSMVDDGGGVDTLQKKIFASAQNSRGAYQATADSVAKLGLMAGEAFTSNNEIIAFAEQVNKQFTIAGTEASGMDSAWLQLTQAMGSGVLRGEEYNSILEQAPNIIQSIAKYLDVPKGKLKDMAAEGKITADIVKNAMFAAADETNAKFNAMPKTFAQTFQSMKNEALMAFQPILNKLNVVLNSEQVQKFVSGATKGLATVGNIALNVLNKTVKAASAVYNFFAKNWSKIAPIIVGIVTAVAAYNAALLVHKAYLAGAAAIQGIKTAIEYAHAKAIMKTVAAMGAEATAAQLEAAGLTAETVASASATVAQTSFNTALWACPITWIIALLIALIVVFVMFTEQIMGAIFWLGALFKNIGLWIANCGIAAWGVIKNVGLWFANLGLAIWQVIKNIGAWFGNLGQAVWAIIKNVGAWFGNLGMGVWNVLKAAASNIATAFKNGWIDIQVGFWSMVNVIMQGIKEVADLANTCLGWMGVNIDTSGLDFAAQKIDELNAKKDEYKDISEAWEEGQKTFEYADVGEAFSTYSYGDVGEAFNTNQLDWSKVGEGFNTFDTFQKGWGTEAYDAGAKVGAGISDWIDSNIGGLFSGETGNAFNGALGYENTLDDIAGDTSDIADCGNKTSEELAYLRDIAEREAINRFTTAEIKVDFSSTNTISSDMDIDGVIEQFEREISEALVTAAEGDY